jgi:hypothetical protein
VGGGGGGVGAAYDQKQLFFLRWGWVGLVPLPTTASRFIGAMSHAPWVGVRDTSGGRRGGYCPACHACVPA